MPSLTAKGRVPVPLILSPLYLPQVFAGIMWAHEESWTQSPRVPEKGVKSNAHSTKRLLSH
jgi:hypothetical protein